MAMAVSGVGGGGVGGWQRRILMRGIGAGVVHILDDPAYGVRLVGLDVRIPERARSAPDEQAVPRGVRAIGPSRDEVGEGFGQAHLDRLHGPAAICSRRRFASDG